jgi:hypothetical protein
MVFKQQNVRREGFSPEYSPLFEKFLESRRKSGITDSSIANTATFCFDWRVFSKTEVWSVLISLNCAT